MHVGFTIWHKKKKKNYFLSKLDSENIHQKLPEILSLYFRDCTLR